MDRTEFDKLTDDALLALLEKLASQEREQLPYFLGCLAAADDRKAHEGTGYPSLFEYCTKRLRYSEDEAYRRIHAARAATKFPQIYSMLQDGSLSLTAVSRLAPCLTKENADELLGRAQNKRIRAVEELRAGQSPKPDTADRTRVLKVTASPPPPHDGSTLVPNLGILSNQTAAAANQPAPDPPTPASDRFEISFTGSRALLESLERLKDVLWHKYPLGRLEDLFSEAISDYLRRHERGQLRLLDEARPKADASSRKRPVPAWVRRAVWARDRGRCSFIGSNGIRCETRRALEWDHIKPFSQGGRSDDPKNVRLLCRAHNQFERRRLLGG